MIYFGSDGLEDQNNVKRKRFGKTRLKKLLADIASLPIENQKQKIEETLQYHMEGTTQRDDILWMGVRIS